MPSGEAKIRLDELLVKLGHAETRSQAQRLILAGEVLVGDEVADKPGRLFAVDSPVRVRQPLRYVSRGGLKLEAALEAFEIRPDGWICADIGASTGGFTDCLLQYGAAHVYAIDVGYGQLAWSLRQDPRVSVLERVNIRRLETLPEPVQIAVIDVSFIGLGLVIPRARALLAERGHVVALVKPQFEVGKGQVGKGGVVRDPKLHAAAVENVAMQAQAIGLAFSGVLRSPITGPAGNVEFLAWLRLDRPPAPAELIRSWIAGATTNSA